MADEVMDDDKSKKDGDKGERPKIRKLKSHRRAERERSDDMADDLSELDKTVTDLAKKIERKSGVPWWLVVLPVGILFVAGIVLPLVQWAKARRRSRTEQVDDAPADGGASYSDGGASYSGHRHPDEQADPRS